MRRLLFFIFILSALNSLANGYTDKFFEDGKCWLLERKYPYLDKTEYYNMYVDGDTIVDGIQAKKIRQEWCDSDKTGDVRIGYEKDGVVYIYFPDYDSEFPKGRFIPIIDFNAIVGDVLNVQYSRYIDSEYFDEEEFEILYPVISVTIYDVKFLEINNTVRKTTLYNYTNYPSEKGKVWIEGIGVSQNPLNEVLVSFQEDLCYCEDRWYDMIFECYQGEECIYQASRLDEYLGLTPGLSGIDKIIHDDINPDEPIYDLMGRRVSLPQPGKIYVTSSGKRLYR